MRLCIFCVAEQNTTPEECLKRSKTVDNKGWKNMAIFQILIGLFDTAAAIKLQSDRVQPKNTEDKKYFPIAKLLSWCERDPLILNEVDTSWSRNIGTMGESIRKITNKKVWGDFELINEISFIILTRKIYSFFQCFFGECRDDWETLWYLIIRILDVSYEPLQTNQIIYLNRFGS